MNQRKDTLSIIVPIYNVESYLRQCIESILSQTYQNLELILVDDGSTDESGNICDEYVKKDNRVSVIHKKNGGLVSARKTGIEQAKGTYVTYVDGDDWIEPTLYEEIFSAIYEQQPDVALFGLKEDYPDRIVEVRNTVPCGFYNQEDINIKIISGMINGGSFFTFGILPNLVAKVAKRELLLKAQKNVKDVVDIGEDAVCTTNIMLGAKTAMVLSSTGYHYCKRNDSMMGKSTPYVKLEALFCNLQETFRKHKAEECLMEQLWNYMLFVFLLKQSEAFFTKGSEDGIFRDIQGRKVALYGAGGFGQEVYKKITEAKVADVSVWVDKRFQLYQEYNFPVRAVEDLKEKSFDVLLIAILNMDTCELIKNELIAMGIPENKIKYITNSKENLEIVKSLLLRV